MSDTKSISKRKKKSAGQINLSDLWNPAMNSVWNEISPFVIGKENRGDIPPCKYDELFLQGGRASGKSYFASVIVWLSLINDPKKNAVIVRKVGSSIAKSCWEQMLKVRNRLGLYDWKENNTKMLIRNKATKQQIYFIGLDDEEKAMFLEELGISESGLDRLIKCSYSLLGLISFLTAGSDEVRAWTITKGTRAPQAAGKIHTDFERGFIRAEVIAFDDLKATGSMAAAREKGLIRSEGKEYVMKDGDIVTFRFNV